MNIVRTLIAVSLLLTSAAFAGEGAATLSGQQGTVLVNQGEEFVTASASQALNPGDRVLVMEGGSAEITYADGCVLPLESGSMLSVSTQSTCAGDVAQVEQIGPSFAQAVGAPAEQHDPNHANADSKYHCLTDAEGDCDNTAAWWIFGAWTVGIAYAIQASP